MSAACVLIAAAAIAALALLWRRVRRLEKRLQIPRPSAPTPTSVETRLMALERDERLRKQREAESR
ncbi:hypothetical protein [Pseudoxanthomonas sp. SE1]|uniref:hypothetical protein n=1 Tax=Pseudoxanthomonas sp. SE1 TaxID=1664560 RepID=UPI00240E4ED0|nr:hypothetical protein [Pseudoxanthomonas sp. SE1]WFC43170.1 hypothetical protein OY559_06585 [Pseudoxanthomonas sp. SE1]